MNNYLNYLLTVWAEKLLSLIMIDVWLNDKWLTSYIQCCLKYLPTFILIPNVCINDAEYIDGLLQGRRNYSALAMEFYVFHALSHRWYITFSTIKNDVIDPFQLLRLNLYSLYNRGACRCFNTVSYKTSLHHWRNYDGVSASRLTKDIP